MICLRKWWDIRRLLTKRLAQKKYNDYGTESQSMKLTHWHICFCLVSVRSLRVKRAGKNMRRGSAIGSSRSRTHKHQRGTLNGVPLWRWLQNIVNRNDESEPISDAEDKVRIIITWYARLDSNQRPLESESNALSNWATGAYAVVNGHSMTNA